MAPEFEHLAESLDEDTQSVGEELRARLDANPSDKDWLAITTALAKAAVIGLRRGAAEFSEQLDEALPADEHVEWHLDLECNDVWAHRYAQGVAAGRSGANALSLSPPPSGS